MSEVGNMELGSDRRSQRDFVIGRAMTTVFATLCLSVTAAWLALLLWGPHWSSTVSPTS